MYKSKFLISQCILFVFVFFIIMGCAQQHSVQVNEESLTFYYSDDKAKEIFFSSSADHFQYHPAVKGPDNVWHVTVPLNKEFTYFYIVDGKVTVPGCQNSVLDDFGSKNCLYIFGM